MVERRNQHDRLLQKAPPTMETQENPVQIYAWHKNPVTALRAEKICEGVLHPTTVRTVCTYPGSTFHADVVPVKDQYKIYPVHNTPNYYQRHTKAHNVNIT